MDIKKDITVRNIEQLKGICSAMYYSNLFFENKIEEEKEMSIVAIQKEKHYEVHISYISCYIEPFMPSTVTCVLIVKERDKVYSLVKDIIVELEIIQKAEMPKLINIK